ncbi:MAG: S8 family serine peptidase [Pseudomonadota bacterium]
MANNPVQIVLNDNDYVIPPEPGKGGPPFDFFAGRDDEFLKHKAKIAAQIQETATQLSSGTTGEVGYVRVKLREKALAKSHRPNRVMFTSQKFPCVGAAGVGELFYFARSDDLSKLIDTVSEAELRTNWRENSVGDLVARPSKIRSEVGAIEELGVPDPSAKRRFDAETAVSWLSEPRTGGYYLLEMFENPKFAEQRLGDGDAKLVSSLEQLLGNLGQGVVAWRLPDAGGERPIALKITDQPDAPKLLSSRPVEREISRVDPNSVRHDLALQRLAEHPSIRRISLPVRIELSDVDGASSALMQSVPPKTNGVRYPKMGVVDSGLGTALAPWVLGRYDFLSDSEVDKEHGSFVAGLVVGAQSLNPALPGLEGDGCELVDIPLFPKNSFKSVYPGGFDDFLTEMDQAIGEAVTEHGIRVINLSINAVSPVEADQYSYYAARMDEIASKNGVVIVNSAGNLKSGECRAPWPKRPGEAIKYFASRVEPDTIYMPSESYQTLSVGAINPPGCSVHHEGLPTTYTRRGPGLRVGCKPDVAHYGGNDGSSTKGNHCLSSISQSGTLKSSCGTSYAAPLIAKSLASLDNLIDGELAAHTLRALLIHNCTTPDPLNARGLKHLARQFVGFGVPSQSVDMMITDDHSITLVFNSRIVDDEKRPKILRFGFDWPPSLVDPTTGACFGEANATLVYEPPVDRSFGAEFVRVNLDAKLMQRQPKDRKDGLPSYRDRFQQCFLPQTANQPVPEKELIKQGLKWWPTKRYQTKFPKAGIGENSQWRIEVSTIRRAEAPFPKGGIPFSLVVTIKDPEGIQPVFQQLRRSLQAGRVLLEELRTYQRVRTTG